MKFACKACGAQNSVADDALGVGVEVSVPCNQCGRVLKLKRKAPVGQSHGASPKAAVAAPAKKQAEEHATRAVSIADLRDQLRSPADPAPPHAARDQVTCAACGAQHDIGKDERAALTLDLFTCPRCGRVQKIKGEAKTSARPSASPASPAASPARAPGPARHTADEQRTAATDSSERVEAPTRDVDAREIAAQAAALSSASQATDPWASSEKPAAAGPDSGPTPEELLQLVEEEVAADPEEGQGYAQEEPLELVDDEKSGDRHSPEPPPLPAPPRTAPSASLLAAGVMQWVAGGAAWIRGWASNMPVGRRALQVPVAAAALITLLWSLDAMSVVDLPLMGRVYNAMGQFDPNHNRQLARIDDQLATGTLTLEERSALEVLRAALLAR